MKISLHQKSIFGNEEFDRDPKRIMADSWYSVQSDRVSKMEEKRCLSDVTMFLDGRS